MKRLVGDVTNSGVKEISMNTISIQHLNKKEEEEEKESTDFGQVSNLLPTGFSKC